MLAIPIPSINVSSDKMLTQYHGVCIQYNVDLLNIWGGTYLYNDWGKRFCIDNWKSISMFAYFPGYGIHMSTIDPEFLIKQTTIPKFGWFEAKLNMIIEQRLPREGFNCWDFEYGTIKNLEKLKKDHEKCILDDFLESWSKRNRTCYPFILDNYKNLTKPDQNPCDIDAKGVGERSKINEDIYPAMASTCLVPCVQVSMVGTFEPLQFVAYCFARLFMNQLLSLTRIDGKK